MRTLFLLIAALFITLPSCQVKKQVQSAEEEEEIMEIKVTSPVFANGEAIPSKYTCDGKDISPPIHWESVPPQTKSIALICDDPDAPMGTWVHWVIFNIPPDKKELPENVPPAEKILSDGSVQGKNSWGKTGYGGPCPPSGVHRYFFKVYALDAKLSLQPGSSKNQLEEAMNGHILAKGELMGTYERKRK